MPDRHRHTWQTRTSTERQLGRDGFPDGFWQIVETRQCSCGRGEVRRVPGTRARSPEQAEALHRQQQVAEASA